MIQNTSTSTARTSGKKNNRVKIKDIEDIKPDMTPRTLTDLCSSSGLLRVFKRNVVWQSRSRVQVGGSAMEADSLKAEALAGVGLVRHVDQDTEDAGAQTHPYTEGDKRVPAHQTQETSAAFRRSRKRPWPNGFGGAASKWTKLGQPSKCQTFSIRLPPKLKFFQQPRSRRNNPNLW